MDDSDSDDSDASAKERQEKRRRLEDFLSYLAAATAVLACADDDPDPPSTNSQTCSNARSRPSRSKKATMFVRDENGNVVQMTPTLSPWYQAYIQNPQPDNNKWLRKFRLRFRVPYASFFQLVSMLKEPQYAEYFGRWTGGTPHQEAAHFNSAPIELFLLGALRYLGRGWTFDDLEESTGVDEEVHPKFFHSFIKWGGSILFKMYVSIPGTSDEARCNDYEVAGMCGCVGSMDATHVLAEKIFHDLKQEHNGHKLHGTARTYNIVSNHRRRILSTTHGHPARWNDKTIVKYDEMATMLKYGRSEELDNHKFHLKEKKTDGTVHEVQYRGAWLLVDNGYLDWSCTVPPIKTSDSLSEIRFSQWLESLRKDVECTFGIMKGRFRLLKAGVRLHGIEAVDNVWKTCCALHNLLLDYDGFDDGDDWLSDSGHFDSEDIENAIPLPIQRRLQNANDRIQRRLKNPNDVGSYDSSGMGVGNDRITSPEDKQDGEDNEENDEETNTIPLPALSDEEYIENAKDNNGDIRIRLLPLRLFRSKLVQHFEILYEANMVQWSTIKD